MRKRRWVLWFFMNEYVITEDAKTPLFEFDKMNHCLGVYESYKEGLERATLILNQKIKASMENLLKLKKRKSK